MREDGYYWCKSSERISDHGGHAEGEWVIVDYDHDGWQYFIPVSDEDWQEIDENQIKRK